MSNENASQDLHDQQLKAFDEVITLVKKAHKSRLKPLSKNNLIDIIMQLTAKNLMLKDQLDVAKALMEQQ